MIAQLDDWSSPIKITCWQALHVLFFISLHRLVIVLFVTQNGVTESHMLCNCLLFILCYCCKVIFAHWVIWHNLWLIQLLDDDVDLFITILLILHGITESCWTLYHLRQLLKNLNWKCCSHNAFRWMVNSHGWQANFASWPSSFKQFKYYCY